MVNYGDEQERWQALRDYYVHKARDPKWSILLLEFKLYALRRPKARASLAAEYRSIRANIKGGEIGHSIRGQTEWSPAWNENLRIALQTLLHGLTIERAYDPSSLSEMQLAHLLEQFFDFAVPKPVAGPSEEQQDKSLRNALLKWTNRARRCEPLGIWHSHIERLDAVLRYSYWGRSPPP